MNRFTRASIVVFIIGLIAGIIGFVIFWYSNPTVNWINNQPSATTLAWASVFLTLGLITMLAGIVMLCLARQYDLMPPTQHIVEH